MKYNKRNQLKSGVETPLVKIFSGTSSRYLAEEIAAAYRQPLGACDVQKFSDGEM
ncbi:MAG: ribose-phosphate pyrophosphokinase-like domain-containing protein, partial [Catalinimonas sp.]